MDYAATNAFIPSAINPDNTHFLKLLIIDDDEVDCLSIKRSLRDAGIKNSTDTAGTGKEGLALLKEKNYDCVFIDFKLPDVDGLSLLRQLRNEGILAPVLLVTSHGDERIAAEAIKLGAFDYIPKTLLSPDGIALSLRNAIRYHKIKTEKKSTEKNLEKTQAQLAAILSTVPMALWSIDNQGTITYGQGMGFDLIGIKISTLVGSSIFDVYGAYPDIVEKVNRSLAGEVIRNISTIEELCFESHFVPIYNENREICGVTGVSFDITDRIRTESELKHAKELAEQSVKVKEQFIANISHEIRTPMNGIIGLSKVLQNSLLNDEQRKYLRAIQTSADNLLVIINDLLDFSKIEALKITFEQVEFSLQDQIQELLHLMETKACEKGNILKALVDSKVPPLLIGDPVKLNQILLNLIGNACKFTENGLVKLLIEVLSETDEEIWLEFTVEDNGIGILPEKLSLIFESFSQASSDTTRKYGGTGLGLTISKRLVEMQGGKLSVESTPGKGSSFNFMIPFTKSQKATPVTAAIKQPEQENAASDLPGALRILVAEDNPINQLLAEKVLTDWGFNVSLADNGKIALEKVSQEPLFDIILMDVQMPEMDGYEATRSIRSLAGERAGIPIIALTAHATQGELEKCITAGADSYISKPFDPDELLKEISGLVRKNQF